MGPNQTIERGQFKLSNAYLECTLRKGDVLYLPRGHWHNVNPLDEVSLHLTLGVFIPNGVEFLLWLVDECTELPEARENIPLKVAVKSEDDYLQARSEYIKRILDVLVQRSRSDDLGEEYDSFCTASLPNRAPFNFPFSIARRELMPSSDTPLVALNDGAKIVAGTCSDSASVIYPNREIKVPIELVAAAREMLSGLPFTVDRIGSRSGAEGSEGIRDLVRTLVAEGLVRPLK